MMAPSLFAHIRDIFLLPVTVTVVVPWLVHRNEAPERYETPEQSTTFILVGSLMLLGGATLLFYTIFLFRIKGNGTLAPWAPTQKLVITGPYKYCRNPMISGVFFVLLGEVLIFHSMYILLWAFIFFLINNIYFSLKEEPDLYKRFGEDYLRYKRHVPRWIPRLKPYHG